jgi:hydroxymethylpyrimidine pyrophosphatase-like HAD family hydrolase
MFANVDYGIAMSHATAELQGVASYVAATDSGVLEGLQHYRLC